MSSELIALYNKDERYIKDRFEFYFDGDDKEPTVFSGDNYVMSSSLLEELAAESKSPLGAISSNELSITLINDDKRFIQTNTESPLYGKLVPNIKVIAYYRIEDGDKFVDTKLGTFYTSTWKADTGSMEAEVVCYDMLYTYGELEIPAILPERFITLKAYIQKVFKALNIDSSMYEIDSSLTYTLDIAWFPKVPLKEFLQDIAEGYGCIVYVNEDGKLIIKYSRAASTPIAEISDTNQIVSMSVPQEIMSLYSKVELTFNRPQVSDKRLLVELKDVILREGKNTISNITFENSPVVRIDTISIENSVEVDLIDWSYDSFGITLNIIMNDTNTNDKTFIVRVYGYVVDSVEQTVTSENSALSKIIGDRTLKIQSKVIQHYEEAVRFSKHVLALASNLDTFADMQWLGNPAIKLGDTVLIDNATDKISGRYTLYRSELNHDGALDGKARFIKVVV